MTVRTRFSPSPTGMIHIGNARAALFSALYAKKNQGEFVLRVEDTDASRSSVHFIELLQEDLHWLGVFWQEGPDKSGPFGPYLQSERQEIYAEYYKKLEQKQLMYPCFCTDQELLLSRKLQLSRGQAPRYAGTCLKLSAEELAEKLATTKPAWRFKVPVNTQINFTDIVKGEQSFKSDDIGDFIIRRADTTSPFLFCNAIDDATMKISHVLRGEDHLANTPRQILILQALGLPIPQYGHLSMIVGEDGTPLSKRHGSFSVQEMRKQGYLAIALLNYLGRLGHTCDVQALLPFADLATHFQLDRLSKSPARFDLVQLLYWQKLAVQALDKKAIWTWLGDEIKAMVPADKADIFASVIQANINFPNEAKEWAQILFASTLSLEHLDFNLKTQLKDAGEIFFTAAMDAFKTHQLNLKAALDDIKTKTGASGKKLFMPLRVALTGRTDGPELQQIVNLLGVEQVIKRLQLASKSI